MAENITVVTPGPTNVTVQEQATNVTVTVSTGVDVAVVENGAVPQNLYVQPTEPDLAASGLWVQTFDNGDWTLWIEDGT